MNDAESKPWWLQPITLESLTKLAECVDRAHSSGRGFASVTMSQIKIALAELKERMEEDQEIRKLVEEMRKYILHHGILIGECIAWNKLKKVTGVEQE